MTLSCGCDYDADGAEWYYDSNGVFSGARHQTCPPVLRVQNARPIWCGFHAYITLGGYGEAK